MEMAKGAMPLERIRWGTKRTADSVARAVSMPPRSVIQSCRQPRSVSRARTVFLASGCWPERKTVGVDLPPASVYLSWHQRYDSDRAHRWLRTLARTTLTDLMPN
jgi:hypothetical protein